MTSNTKEIIIMRAKSLFAKNGYEGFSMRILAKDSGVGLSSIYHFFADKDVLLKYIFDDISKELGTERYRLTASTTASDMLYARILFQFTHIEKVVYVQKYYLHFRNEFPRGDNGYIPTKAYLHIDEVLRFGITKNEFYVEDSEVSQQAKVITHSINGFLLEYYPLVPEGFELKSIATTIHQFIMRSLTNKEVAMK
jgi:AcrR family transcriptional regulator